MINASLRPSHDELKDDEDEGVICQECCAEQRDDPLLNRKSIEVEPVGIIAPSQALGCAISVNL